MKIMNRRIIREFSANWVRYTAFSLLIIFGFAFVVGGSASNSCIVRTIEDNFETSVLEDGTFSAFFQLSEDDIAKIEENGVSIEEMFYTDVKCNNDNTLRVFRVRQNINKITVDTGELPVKSDSLLLEQHYAELNNYTVGSNLTLAGKNFTVSGIGSVPDYTYVKKNVSDISADHQKFSIAFLNEEAFNSFCENLNDDCSSLTYCYGFRLNGAKTQSDFQKLLNDIGVTLTAYTQKSDNSRINAYQEDCGIMSKATLVCGALFTILLAYVLATFAAHTIDKEKKIIGTFYASGFSVSELRGHYIVLPLLITAIGSILSIVFGYAVFFDLLSADSIALYSMPAVKTEYPLYVILYALFVPLIITFIVNFMVITKRLSKSPLSMLSSGPNEKVHEYNLNTEKLGFINTFRIRHFLRESAMNIVMFFGILLAMSFFVIGFTLNDSFQHYIDHVADNMQYNYTYMVAGLPENLPDSVQCMYSKTLKYDAGDNSTLSVVVQGVDKDNHPYYDFFPDTAKDEIVLSHAVADKFNLHINDTITLTDSLTNDEYTFKISDIAGDESTLYAYMDRKAMTECFDIDTDVYNTIISENQLNIPENLLINTVTMDDVTDAAQAQLDSASMMIAIINLVSMIIFAVVVYLILKMIIDRSTMNVSLMKIFGYNKGELNKIYFGSATATVIVSLLISLLIGTLIAKKLFPFLVSGVDAHIQGFIAMPTYAEILAFMLVIYFIIQLNLRRKLNRIPMQEIIRNRD